MTAHAASVLPDHSAQRKTRAFTLVELLMVMAVIVVLLGVMTPAITTMTRGSQLTQSAQLLDDQLNLARQLALAKNMTVEVRLYQYADATFPGETAGNASSGKYRAFQFFTILDSGQQAVPLGKIQRLQPTIIMDSGSTLSSLIGLATGATSVPAKVSATTGSTSIPQIGTAYNYVAFRYTPGGSTNLDTSKQWFLTLHNIKDGDAPASTPTDFFTAQIDAGSGHLRTFHR